MDATFICKFGQPKRFIDLSWFTYKLQYLLTLCPLNTSNLPKDPNSIRHLHYQQPASWFCLVHLKPGFRSRAKSWTLKLTGTLTQLNSKKWYPWLFDSSDSRKPASSSRTWLQILNAIFWSYVCQTWKTQCMTSHDNSVTRAAADGLWISSDFPWQRFNFARIY